jgi:transposase
MVHARRVIVNAIVYVNRTGCAWRYLPNDLPPWRHIAVDATGLVLAVVIITAPGPGPRRRSPLLWNLSRCCTRVRLAWADAGYADRLATWAASLRI